jgi:mono/diheme cytochrome c family protein
MRELPVHTRRAVVAAAVTVGIVVTLAATASTAQVKPPRQDYTSGAYLYRTFCASCHGQAGRGDGVVADVLRQRPPDLTRISLRYGGSFPRAGIFAAIDGRRVVRGHGSTDMPIWGDVLKVTEGNDDAIVKKRIDALVSHLEALQEK